VDHRVEARPASLGALTASRPLLIRVPADGSAEPRIAFDSARQDERLALQVDLSGEGDRLSGAAVVFEVAAAADGPALIQAAASMSPGSRDGSMRAQAVANLRILPPGRYTVRARVTAGDELQGAVSRPFTLLEAPRTLADAASAPASTGHPAPRLTVRGTIPPFALDQVLAPPILNMFLDRVSARPDARSPVLFELLNRARGGSLERLEVPEAAGADAPVAAFLKGLALLSQKKLEPAAAAFRTAMNLSADFYPAMVYLGACYAAGGKDKEAAAIWRTALIKESDTAAVHILLTDALLRQDRGDLAILQVEQARARWPGDQELNRRFALAALLAGRYVDGLDAVESLVAAGVNDEPSLALALLVLYEAFEKGRPIQDADRDRARMIRLSEGYRAQGGPSIALVDAWVSAATRKQ
jgi:tetratricopeptide (TPR) repeat protein